MFIKTNRTPQGLYVWANPNSILMLFRSQSGSLGVTFFLSPLFSTLPWFLSPLSHILIKVLKLWNKSLSFLSPLFSIFSWFLSPLSHILTKVLKLYGTTESLFSVFSPFYTFMIPVSSFPYFNQSTKAMELQSLSFLSPLFSRLS